MDLEIVGRHALLFDDDPAAEVVNCGGSLVPWSAAGAVDLLLDRHDVRHLLDHVPPRPHRSYSAALLSIPSPDGISESELDRERFLDLPADDDGGEIPRDASLSGNGTGSVQTDYNSVPFLYGGHADSDDLNNSILYYRPSFPVPESLLNKLPPSEKVHQIIARTALFVSEHGGQSEIVLRVKQGNNPIFGFLMPDHHLHSYFRYLVGHPQLLKDGSDADTKCKTVNSESEHAASSSGALSLLGSVYESGDEDEGMDPRNGFVLCEQDHERSVLDKEVEKTQIVTEESAPAVKDKPIFPKKNPSIIGNIIVADHQEKDKHAMTVLTTYAKSEKSKSGVSETKEMILEPPPFLKSTMEKIVEFILRNGKEFEEKLIEQDRTTGRFQFLLPSNPYHSYYLKTLQETQESKSHGGSLERKDRSFSELKDRISPAERKDRRSSERRDRRSSERRDNTHDKEVTKNKGHESTCEDSSASGRTPAEPSDKKLYDKQGNGKLEMVIAGFKKEPPRKVTADEVAAIVMAATRGPPPASAPPNKIEDKRHMQDLDAVSKHASNRETCTSFTNSGYLKEEGNGIIDDDWISNTIAKAVAVAGSKEADSFEASMTNEQKLKAERLRRAKMFSAIIKSGGNKVDLVTTRDPAIESAKASPVHLNRYGPDPQLFSVVHEGNSAPSELEGSNLTKHEDSDDEQNRVRKYRKHHRESDEEKYDLEKSNRDSRKKHRSDHSRGHSKVVHKHKHRRHSKDQEHRHHRHHYSSSEDEHEHKISKSSRHTDDDQYPEDNKQRRSDRHQRDHHFRSKMKHEGGQNITDHTLYGAETSQNTSDHKFGSEKPTSDTAQSSRVTTEVPEEMKAKIRAMLLETL